MSRNRLAIFVLICLAAAVTAYCMIDKPSANIETWTDANTVAAISPDYANVTLPPNIAPLNFRIKVSGEKYCVRIHSTAGQQIEVVSKTPSIMISPKRWRALLSAARGNDLTVDVYVKADGKWTKYKPIINHVADHDIDSHLVYRMLKPNYNFYHDIGIYQRNLTTWDESEILHGRSFGNGCVNCHTFRNNDPGKMFIGVRSKRGGVTLMADEKCVSTIGAKWGYTAWHPDGRIAVYAIMRVRQFNHRIGMESRDVVDLDSALLYYDLKKRRILKSPGFSEKDRLETYPTWSPDGRYLYFCSAAIQWKDRHALPPKNYKKLRYELRRISYDSATGRWGKPETILPVSAIGGSVLLPRISPDGRFLVFSLCDYGSFPVMHPESDLYLIDMKDMENLSAKKSVPFRKLPKTINSRFSESWHSWSHNSRWLVFSSKRQGGLFTRSYFSYIDANGNAHKPFVMPQKHPDFYESFLKTYSVPELVTGPIRVNLRDLIQAGRFQRVNKVNNPLITGATPMSESDAYKSAR